MSAIIPTEGGVAIELAAGDHVSWHRLEQTPTGWTLTSESGTPDDGTYRRLEHAEREPLAAELSRVLTMAIAHGRRVSHIVTVRPIAAS